MLSTKNTMLSPAAQDLGLGDQLKQQVESDVMKRKKKTEQMANGMTAPGGLMGPATQSLIAGIGGYNG